MSPERKTEFSRLPGIIEIRVYMFIHNMIWWRKKRDNMYGKLYIYIFYFAFPHNMSYTRIHLVSYFNKISMDCYLFFPFSLTQTITKCWCMKGREEKKYIRYIGNVKTMFNNNLLAIETGPISPTFIMFIAGYKWCNLLFEIAHSHS